MVRRRLVVLALVLAGCASAPATRDARTPLPASPQFCRWAEAVADATPTLPSLTEGEPLEVERLVQAGAGLIRFADTLSTAATHAPSDSQDAFTFLADFNRSVAEVIAGEQPLDQDQLGPATDAAAEVARTLSDECDVDFDPADGLAYTTDQ